MLRAVAARPAILVTLVALVVTLAGCSDHGAAKLTAIKDKVCACASVVCAEQAMQEVPTQAIQSNHRTQVIARGMMDCMARLQEAERPVTDPDAEGSAADK
jgi:hypothetical protein